MGKRNNKQIGTNEKLEPTPVKARRNYKDSIFRKLFNNKAAIIDLYNALSGSDSPPASTVICCLIPFFRFSSTFLNTDLSIPVTSSFLFLSCHYVFIHTYYIMILQKSIYAQAPSCRPVISSQPCH